LFGPTAHRGRSVRVTHRYRRRRRDPDITSAGLKHVDRCWRGPPERNLSVAAHGRGIRHARNRKPSDTAEQHDSQGG